MQGCQKKQIPASLLDKWAAADKRYHGCYLEISEISIVFGRADMTSEIFTIQKVRTKKKINDKLIVISAVNQAGLPITVELRQNLAGDDCIWFENQPEIKWFRLRDKLRTYNTV
jgi:hypothetical protein